MKFEVLDRVRWSDCDPFGIIFRSYPSRVVAGMICFVAFFGVALGLGNWLPSMIVKSHGFSISSSLLYTAGINLAFPLASAFMMFALERFGRKPTAIAGFILAGLAAVAVGLASSTEMFIVMIFVMTFFIQLAGNSSQTKNLCPSKVNSPCMSLSLPGLVIRWTSSAPNTLL